MALLFFYKLTICIDSKKVSFQLGVGWFGRSYPLSEIKSCKPVRNSIFYGIGIRLIPGGWLYNVSGFKAIELKFHNRRKVVRIGTDKPEEVADLVESAIKNVQGKQT